MEESKDQQSAPNEIRIDRNGTWYFRGAEMIRKDIVRLFYQHLRRDEAGRFVIEMENDRSEIDVEDAPYVVRSVSRVFDAEGTVSSYMLLLNDETVEELEPGTLRIGRENVLYCTVRTGLLAARFSRAAYYQIADWMEHDPERDLFCLAQKGCKFDVTSSEMEN